MTEVIDEPILRDRIHVFDDRLHAGELLAKKLEEYVEKKETYILAIPAGGVEVAFIVAKRLSIPLDLAITRKLHIPWNMEAGFGAVSWDGTISLNEPLITSLGVTNDDVKRCIEEEKKVISRRIQKFRGDDPFPNLQNNTTIIIDDGLASGFSMLTTLKTLEKIGVKEKIVTVPTAPISSIHLIMPHSDKVVCLNIRSGPVFAVADAYKRWYDLEDDDVINILKMV